MAECNAHLTADQISYRHLFELQDWPQGSRSLVEATPRDYNDAMASQNAPANAKRLLKALIDRGNPVAPEGRINQVAADTGLNEGEIRPAIKYARAQGWLEDAKFGHTRGWLSITPSGKAAANS